MNPVVFIYLPTGYYVRLSLESVKLYTFFGITNYVFSLFFDRPIGEIYNEMDFFLFSFHFAFFFFFFVYILVFWFSFMRKDRISNEIVFH